MRAVERAAGGGVARAVFLQHRAIAVLDLDRRMRRAALLHPAVERDLGRRETAERAARVRERRLQPRYRLGAQGGDRDRELGGLVLDRVEPMRVGARHPPAAGCASATRAPAPMTRLRMLGVDREHQPIEEAPAFRSRSGEQPVHRRRQPDDAQVIGEGGRRSDRLAVDTAEPRGARLASMRRASMPVPSVARPSAPSTSAATAQEPSPSLNATSSSVARRSPRPGARNEIASIRLVLPAPFGPDQHDRPVAERELRRAVAAEIGQRQAADAGGGHLRDISIR